MSFKYNSKFKLIFSVLIALLCILVLSLLCCKNPANNHSSKYPPRFVEKLNRVPYAVVLKRGVYISWRLFGYEPLNQKFDIYKNGKMLVSALDATNYTDKRGKIKDVYNVVPTGEKPNKNDNFKPAANNYIDIKLEKPAGGIAIDGKKYSYFPYDASVGDVDADGNYEYFILWFPTNKRDNGFEGYSANAYLDCYRLNGKKLWRIDLGKNIRAGAHYTPFIVYDFDGDGRAEIAMRTTVGSKDAAGMYVSHAGSVSSSNKLIWTDSVTGERFSDTSDLVERKYPYRGKVIKGPDWLTMFDGRTGKALRTINFYPQRGDPNNWGDDNANRSDRFLAGVAYLNGVTPSLIVSRGYYEQASMGAYNWDGKDFRLLWKRLDKSLGDNLYANGNHQLAVCDADNDGKDEIVFGSTVVDNNGKILNSTGHGHGDTLQVSDFDNDGEQEIFQVHEVEPHLYSYGAEVRKAKNAKIISAIPSDKDVGRGVFGNIDDSLRTGVIFSSIDNKLYNLYGRAVGKAPRINPAFLVWWDGDLAREIVFKTHIAKYNVRWHIFRNIEKFKDVKHMERDAPILQADLFGDWREEICYPTKDNDALRIFLTTYPTRYKIPTLMHDTQYRTAVAMQNVAYNQPPYPKFYIGKRAVDKRNRKYLSPATGFDYVRVINHQHNQFFMK